VAKEGIYFNPQDLIHGQVLESYRNTPPYAQELSGTFFSGHVGAEKSPKTAGTAAVLKMLGEVGLTKTVGVPDGFVARLREELKLAAR
jgi:hypothetical protein